MLKFSEIFEFSRETFPILNEFEWFEWFEWFGPSSTEPFNSEVNRAAAGAAFARAADLAAPDSTTQAN